MYEAHDQEGDFAAAAPAALAADIYDKTQPFKPMREAYRGKDVETTGQYSSDPMGLMSLQSGLELGTSPHRPELSERFHK